MKRLIFFFLIFGAALALSAQIGCVHKIYLYDDVGDGWGGGYVDVYVNGNSVISGFTLVSGFRYDWRTFYAANGADIDIHYTSGTTGSPFENSYEIFDGAGVRIGESGTLGFIPESLYDLVGFCPTILAECCTHQVCLSDDYGDGWNGGYLDVFVSGAIVLDGITLANGTGPEYFLFDACVGATIDVYYHAGPWAYENSYTVYDGVGAILAESGAGGLTPYSFRGLAGNCPPNIPDGCDHRIYLYDYAGDGWDGGSVDVYVDGTPVLIGFTLVSGFRYDWRSFSAATGSDIDVYYTPGNAGYAYENSYEVFDGAGARIGESGTGTLTPNNLSDLVGYCPTTPPECCTHQISLTDDFEDGWNGGYLDVFVSGAIVLDRITLVNGSGPEYFAFEACIGATIDVYYHAGSWPWENNYTLYDGGGLVLGESGTGGVSPEDIRGLSGNCIAPQPPCCDHSLFLQNNGSVEMSGEIDVHVDGSPVLTGISIGPGLTTWQYFSACEGADIDVYYTAGASPEDDYYTVLDGDGETLGESGACATQPGDLLDLVGYCPPPPPECCDHSIILWDDGMDGWNGGSIDVYVDDSPVLTGITILFGMSNWVYFSACTGSDIDVYYTAGNSPEENSYTVLDGDGGILGLSGSGFSWPSDLLDLVGYCEPQLYPVNDLCINAIPIDCNATVLGSTIGATEDDVVYCGTSNTSAGVWYSFVATANISNLSTCNQADFDTKISVFSGSCENLVCVGGRDDTPDCSGWTTSLDVNTIPGETYLVLVHGFGSSVGTFELTLSCPSIPCEIIVPPQAPFEYMTGNTLSVAYDPSFVGWTCDNPGWEITSAANLPTIEYTAGTGSADFTVTYDNGTIWTCRVTINSIPATEYCTMTQGFYGNEGGQYCDDRTTTELIEDLLFSNLIIGGPINILTLTPDDAGCVIDRLPASGPSVPISKPSTCGNSAGIKFHKKPPRRFKNTLVGQTITLGLNLRLNCLGPMVMTSRFLTTAASSGCGTNTSPNHPVNAEWRYNEIPESVYSHLGTDPDINALYALANSALGGDPVSGLDLEDITMALEAINDGFDGCMFGTFDGGYWPPSLQQAPFTESFTLTNVNEIEHAIYPNPFNELAIIEFTLPEASDVKVEIYTLNGVRLEILLDAFVEDNTRTTVEFSSNSLALGMYIYVIHTNQGSFHGKMIKND